MHQDLQLLNPLNIRTVFSKINTYVIGDSWHSPHIASDTNLDFQAASFSVSQWVQSPLLLFLWTFLSMCTVLRIMGFYAVLDFYSLNENGYGRRNNRHFHEAVSQGSLPVISVHLHLLWIYQQAIWMLVYTCVFWLMYFIFHISIFKVGIDNSNVLAI